MNKRIIYFVGSVILFLGLLWMFLPHAFHNVITEEDETEHYVHLIQGLIITILGLFIMIITNTPSSKKQLKSFIN